MTVINRSLNHFAPLIGSDLLLSTTAQLPPFVPPTLEADQLPFLEGLTHRPIAMAQKIYVLSDTVCIALAGQVMEMKQILEDLAGYCRVTSPLTAENIRVFLRTCDLSGYRNCAFFLMVIERDREGIIDVAEISMGEFTQVDSHVLDESLVLGSGAEDYMEVITQPMHVETSFPDGDIRQSVVKQGMLIAHMLVRERATKKNLSNAWGGSFEFAVYDGRRFVKPNNVAYVINYGTIDANDRFEIPLPVMVLHHRYEGETLVITKVFWKNHIMRDDGTDMYILTSDDVVAETFIVPSIQRGVFVPEGLKQPCSFDTGWVGMGYLINTYDRISVLPAYFTASADLRVVYTAEAGKVEIYMRETMTGFLQKLIAGSVTAARTNR